MCGTLPDTPNRPEKTSLIAAADLDADNARFSTPASSSSRITWAASLDTVLLDL
jgi:hypothetical protein